MQFLHVQTVVGKGLGAARFRARLAGIAIDTAERLWAIGDRSAKIFSREGKLLERFETGKAAFSIGTDDETAWIGFSGSVVQVDSAGRTLSQIDDPDRLGRVTGVAVAGGHLFLADASNRTIHLYHRDGRWLREIGGDVNTRGFMLPNGVLDLTFDQTNDTLLVAHPQKHRVERYDVDGTLVDKWGRFGMEHPGDFGGCCNPTNIAVSQEGQVVVSEKAPPCVKLYSGSGEFLGETSGDWFDANTKNIDLAFDSRGVLYASDPVACTVEVFERESNSGGAQ